MATPIRLILVCSLVLVVSVSADERKKTKQKQKPQIVVRQIVGGAAGTQAAKATAQLREASKKYVEARKKVVEATKSLSEARQASAAAEAAKKIADDRVAAANKKLQAARREALKQQQALRQRTIPQFSQIRIREKVDPKDPIERFAILVPGGPVVVEAALTVEGKPFRMARQKLVADLMKLADKNKDGKATWKEALSTPRFTLNGFRVVNDLQTQQYVAALDRNKNSLVDADEVRRYVAQYLRSPAFTVSGYGGFGGMSGGRRVTFAGNPRGYGQSQADVQKLLDADGDGTLSADEIASAGQRLKSRDGDDNDLLYPQEINVPVAANNRARPVRSRQQPQRQQLAVQLGPVARSSSLYNTLLQRYKDKSSQLTAAAFSAVPELFKALDKNKDGKLSQDEVMGLNDVRPHVTLLVDLGKPGTAKGLSVKAVGQALKHSDKKGRTVSVELPESKLSFVANLTTPYAANYKRTADFYLGRYDNNKNGYLEKDELAGNLARQMALWDLDDDGKVYPKEIIESYNRAQAPQASQVRVNATSQGNSLFQALDLSGDGRLSLREMKTAHERIKTFDKKNKDNKIARNEIPATFSISFQAGTGGGYGARRLISRAGRPAQPAAVKTDAPEWFTRMDRNGDGDVTLKEFLGDKEDFEKLDKNKDGFIEPKEAKLAK